MSHSHTHCWLFSQIQKDGFFSTVIIKKLGTADKLDEYIEKYLVKKYRQLKDYCKCEDECTCEDEELQVREERHFRYWVHTGCYELHAILMGDDDSASFDGIKSY